MSKLIHADLRSMESNFIAAANGIFEITAKGKIKNFEKGIYLYFPASPTKNLRSALSVSRELLAVVTNFDDLQVRTIALIKEILSSTNNRFEQSIAIVLHNDEKGGGKLKQWGSENGISVISIYFPKIHQGGDLRYLINSELYSQDPFDITGPVSRESEFFGRREEAISFARKIQEGSINSILGIRKTGKTSLINRVSAECAERHKDLIIFIDCSRDDIWSLDSSKLLKTIYVNIKSLNDAGESYSSLSPIRDFSLITSESIISEIDRSQRHIIIIFDEFDYLTPSSPTNKLIWQKQFNNFWRQIRVIYQEVCRRRRNLSVTLCGITSKWFVVPEIDGIENAAAALIPEEYLRPLEENAVVSMVKALGNRCGLSFEEGALGVIYNETSGIPSWIRKFCSYINRRIDVGCRPTKVSPDLVLQLLDEYISGEGIGYSRVAIDHLFSVYPEIKSSINKFNVNPESLLPNERLLLESYGVVKRRKSEYSGKIMKETINFCIASHGGGEVLSHGQASSDGVVSEWADDISELAKRHNLIEKAIRKIILEVVRSDSRQNSGKGSAKDRILAAIPEKSRKEFGVITIDQAIERTFWLDLINIILKKEWVIFQPIFGDKGLLEMYLQNLNIRYHAHAKDFGAVELVAAKTSLKYIEEIILRYENN